MKKIIIILAAILAFYQWSVETGNAPAYIQSALESNNDGAEGDDVANAYASRNSDVQVVGEGEVVKLLNDDNEGSRHQKFILRLPSGKTVLIAHNIDLAPRINAIAKGDKVSFYGEYEWNNRGGVVHWTHRDPNGRHIGGWLKHQGKTYQ